MSNGLITDIPRNRVLRVLFHNQYKTRVNILFKNDKVAKGYIVDENSERYLFRFNLTSPKEIVIKKTEVEGIVSEKVANRLLNKTESFDSTTSIETKEYKVGDRGPAGGWIFYDKGEYSDGWRYLEAAPEDQASENNMITWGSYGYGIPDARGTGIGTGKSNTISIMKVCGEHRFAARACINYRGGDYNDWFLPSKDELKQMYKNLKKKGIGHFNGIFGFDNLYWSSSEENTIAAWYIDFRNSGFQVLLSKYNLAKVRAVRSF